MSQRNETFGQRLRRLREEAGLSQSALSRRIGITQPAISQLETGERENPSYGMLVQLADGIGVTPDILLRDTKLEPSGRTHPHPLRVGGDYVTDLAAAPRGPETAGGTVTSNGAGVSNTARAWRCACGELITHGVLGHESCASPRAEPTRAELDEGMKELAYLVAPLDGATRGRIYELYWIMVMAPRRLDAGEDTARLDWLEALVRKHVEVPLCYSDDAMLGGGEGGIVVVDNSRIEDFGRGGNLREAIDAARANAGASPLSSAEKGS